MKQPDPTSRRPGLWTAFAATAVAGACAVAIALPATIAAADPVPPAPPTTAAPADPAAPPPPADPDAPPPPADPGAPPPPADPGAPPPPADPGAPPPPADPARIENVAGGFSYLLPAGWEAADPSRLSYGQALLLKPTGPAVLGQPAPTANDTSILLGRLDLKLFAGAEQDNSKAAVRLASDMGEFFMPFPGSRINQQSSALEGGGIPGGYAASYDVKFTDTSKPNGQIWVGVVGTPAPSASPGQSGERWFVVYLGTANNPIDTAAATALAQSIQAFTPPPPPAPAPPDPNAPPPPPPAPGDRVGVPIPVETPVPEMMPGA